MAKDGTLETVYAGPVRGETLDTLELALPVPARGRRERSLLPHPPPFEARWNGLAPGVLIAPSASLEATETMMDVEKSRLSQKNIAVLVADGFEYVELSVPKKALRALGANVDIVSLHRGRVRGMNLTEPTRTVGVDATVVEADPSVYDGLFIPGGFVNPDFLRQSRRARDFARAFDEANKPIATLCHGPWVLVSAGLVKGRRLASWPGIRDDVVNAGGVWRDEAVVRDRNWVTSRSPLDLADFVPAMVDLFETGPAPARAVQEGVQALEGPGQSSPQSDHPVPAALIGARLLPGPAVRTLAAAAVGTALGAVAVRRLVS